MEPFSWKHSKKHNLCPTERWAISVGQSLSVPLLQHLTYTRASSSHSPHSQPHLTLAYSTRRTCSNEPVFSGISLGSLPHRKEGEGILRQSSERLVLSCKEGQYSASLGTLYVVTLGERCFWNDTRHPTMPRTSLITIIQTKIPRVQHWESLTQENWPK